MILGVVQQQNAVTVDVTPDAVNWSDISPPGVGNVQTITGINTIIDLKFTISSSVPMSVSINGGSFTSLVNNDLFQVSNNDTVQFRADTFGSAAILIYNNSDSDAFLDGFILSGGPII